MNCEDIQLLVIHYILSDNGLTPEEDETFTAHMAVCNLCAVEFAGTARVIRAIRNLPPEQPAKALAGRVGGQTVAQSAGDRPEDHGASSQAARSDKPCIHKDLKPRRPTRMPLVHMLAPAALVACFVLIITARLFVRGSGHPHEATHRARQNEPNNPARLAIGTVQAVDDNSPGSTRSIVPGQTLTAFRQELPDVLAVVTAASEDPVEALPQSHWHKQRFAALHMPPRALEARYPLAEARWRDFRQAPW